MDKEEFLTAANQFLEEAKKLYRELTFETEDLRLDELNSYISFLSPHSQRIQKEHKRDALNSIIINIRWEISRTKKNNPSQVDPSFFNNLYNKYQQHTFTDGVISRRCHNLLESYTTEDNNYMIDESISLFSA